MLKKIVSGCHPGAEIGAIDAAIISNFPCGGWVQKGNPAVNLGNDIFQEMITEDYPKCREQNVIDSDGTIILTHGSLSESSDLGRYAIKHSKPWIHLDMTKNRQEDAVQRVSDMLKYNGISVLNITGTSADRDEWIYGVTYSMVDELLQRLPQS